MKLLKRLERHSLKSLKQYLKICAEQEGNIDIDFCVQAVKEYRYGLLFVRQLAPWQEELKGAKDQVAVARIEKILNGGNKK